MVNNIGISLIASSSQERTDPFKKRADDWMSILDEMQQGNFARSQVLFGNPLGLEWLNDYLKGNCKSNNTELVMSYRSSSVTALSTLPGSLADKYKLLYKNIINEAFQAIDKKYQELIKEEKISETKSETLYKFIAQVPFLSIKGSPQVLLGFLVFELCHYLQKLDMGTQEGCNQFDTFINLHFRHLDIFIKEISNDSVYRDFCNDFRKFDPSLEVKSLSDRLNFDGIIFDPETSPPTVGVLNALHHTLKLCQSIKDKELARNVVLSVMRTLDRGVCPGWILDTEFRCQHRELILDTLKKLQDCDCNSDDLNQFSLFISIHYILPITAFYKHSLHPLTEGPELKTEYFGIPMPFRYDLKKNALLAFSEEKLSEEIMDFYRIKSSSEYKILSKELLDLLELFRIPFIQKTFPTLLYMVMYTGLMIRLAPWQGSLPSGDLRDALVHFKAMNNYPEVFTFYDFANDIRSYLMSLEMLFSKAHQTLSKEEKQILLETMLILGPPKYEKDYNSQLSLRVGSDRYTRNEVTSFFELYCNLLVFLEEDLKENTEFRDILNKLRQQLVPIKRTDSGVKISNSKRQKESLVAAEKITRLVKQRQEEIIKAEMVRRKKEQDEARERRTMIVAKQILPHLDMTLSSEEKFDFRVSQQEVCRLEMKAEKKQQKNHEPDPARETVEKQNEEIKVELDEYYVHRDIYDTLVSIFKNSPVPFRDLQNLFNTFGIKKDIGWNGDHLKYNLTDLKRDYQWEKSGNTYRPIQWTPEGLCDIALVTIVYESQTGLVNYLNQIKTKLERLGIIPEFSVFAKGDDVVNDR